MTHTYARLDSIQDLTEERSRLLAELANNIDERRRVLQAMNEIDDTVDAAVARRAARVR